LLVMATGRGSGARGRMCWVWGSRYLVSRVRIMVAMRNPFMAFMTSQPFPFSGN
jgi:hypothetical protein